MTKEGFFAYSLPDYQASGEKFKTKPFEGAGVGYTSDSTIANANYKKFVDFFKKNHFDNTSSQPGDSGYLSATDRVVFVNYDIYESSDIFCSVWHADASGTSLQNHVASLGCAKKESYKTAAKTFAPFYAAYTKANENAKDLTFGNPTVKDGTAGYKNAAIYQVDLAKTPVSSLEGKTYFSGLYYQAPDSKDWTFFKSADGSLPCSEFNSDTLKKAFVGIACTNGTATTTVQ